MSITRPRRGGRAMLALAAALLAGPASAHEYYAEHFQIIHPWVHPSPPGAREVGVFMLFTQVSANDRLIAARSEVAERIELRRADADGIAIPAGRTLSLSPFGAHLVLHELKTELHEGRQYPLLLVFEKSGEIAADFVVGAH